MVYFQTQSQVVVKILPGSVMDIVMMETTMLIATLMEAIAVTIVLQIGITIAKFVSVLKIKQKGHPQVSISKTNISSTHRVPTPGPTVYTGTGPTGFLYWNGTYYFFYTGLGPTTFFPCLLLFDLYWNGTYYFLIGFC